MAWQGLLPHGATTSGSRPGRVARQCGPPVGKTGLSGLTCGRQSTVLQPKAKQQFTVQLLKDLFRFKICLPWGSELTPRVLQHTLLGTRVSCLDLSLRSQ